MVMKRYGVEVRYGTNAKSEYDPTNNSHNSNRQLNNQFASFPVLLQNLHQTVQLLADNCCPHG